MNAKEITIQTQGRGLYDLLPALNEALAEQTESVSMCHLFVHHTSASLTVTENADPDVHRDLEGFMARLAPDGAAEYLHSAEGPDDMPAHIRSALTQTSLMIPLANQRLKLGTWQSVYLWEHRLHPHRRRITLSFF